MSLRLKSSIMLLLLAGMGFSVIQACDAQQPIDRKAVIEEMNARELKRIPETQILQTAEKMADTIAEKAEKALEEALITAIQQKGVLAALKVCNVNALPIVNKVSKEKGVKVSRVTDRPRNPMNETDSLESLILEAYQYNIEKDIVQEASIMRETDEILRYTKPISISGGLCLNCHGQIGTEIKGDSYETILGDYPEDQAIGYELNDLCGMWVIKLPVKEVVNAL